MATMKRKFERTDDQESLAALRAEQTGASAGTKSSIARVLSILKERGQLADDHLGGANEYNALIRSSRKHGDTTTPYGTVVQRTKLDGDYVLTYVHPCAILYYLTSISKDFATFINGVLDSQGAKPLNVIVYGGEMTPGNPLRPDEGRKARQWSFSFVEFPNHVLHSIEGWIHITTLRSSELGKIRGGVPMLAKEIMRLPFDQTDNLTGGFHVERPDGSMRPFHARSKGFFGRREGA